MRAFRGTLFMSPARPQSSNSKQLPAVLTAQPGQVPAPAIGQVPTLVANLGPKAKKRFTTFFTDNIRNKNTREAYFRAAFQFFNWCGDHRLSVDDIESYHVSAYIEELCQ